MVFFPNCKINLGLNIVAKREDGYHDLETFFYPVPFTDALEINRLSENDNQLIFNTSGLSIAGESANNLCVKAYHLLRNDFPQLPNIQIHLHKCIPMGAGLGGGSSNGAFTLLLLNKKFNLQLTREQLYPYALRLGSDCPFFILNQPCFATGRGEQLEQMDISLKGYRLLLVNPGLHVSTKEAFSGIAPKAPSISIKQIIQQPIEQWRANLQNDFEEPVFKIHPEIAAIKQELYANGAIYASMTGTGSTVFGLFNNDSEIVLKFDNQYLTKVIDL